MWDQLEDSIEPWQTDPDAWKGEVESYAYAAEPPKMKLWDSPTVGSSGQGFLGPVGSISVSWFVGGDVTVKIAPAEPDVQDEARTKVFNLMGFACLELKTRTRDEDGSLRETWGRLDV